MNIARLKARTQIISSRLSFGNCRYRRDRVKLAVFAQLGTCKSKSLIQIVPNSFVPIGITNESSWIHRL